MKHTLIRTARAVLAVSALAAPAGAQSAPTAGQPAAASIEIGETLAVHSRVLGETRRINVFRPYLWWDTTGVPLPVMYMPDGGVHEDFLHVMGLLQVSVMNGTMRPFLLVGIENTERRRDLTGPTDDPEDRKIAPRVGGSAAFRAFLRTELMPLIEARYATTAESAIVGESLAGLFIVETLIEEPTLFDTYIAFDPSLWWNGGKLLERAAQRAAGLGGRTVYLASSSESEIASLTARLAGLLEADGPETLQTLYAPMPEETHATIYHPAAVRAFRSLFAPPPEPVQ